MRAHIVGKKNVILDRYVPGECDFVRENVVVTDNTVVRNVNADHKKISRAGARYQSFAAGPVKSAELTNDVVVADLEIARLAAELHVLRLTADYGMLKDAIPGAEPCVSLDDSIGRDLAIRANFHVILYYRCGVNRHF